MKEQDRKFNHKVSTRLTDSQYDCLEAIAYKTELNYSQILRYAFEEYLIKMEII